MKKILTILVAIVALLNLTLVTVLAISFGWAFAFTVVGYAIPATAALLGLSYGCYRLAKKKWIFAYVPSISVLLLAVILEIVFLAFNLFPGLSGLIPTMLVLVGLTGSVITLVTVRIVAWMKTKPKKM